MKLDIHPSLVYAQISSYLVFTYSDVVFLLSHASSSPDSPLREASCGSSCASNRGIHSFSGEWRVCRVVSF